MDKSNVPIIFSVVAGIGVIALMIIYFRKKEKFMIAKEPTRCSLGSSDDSQSPEVEPPADSIIFVIKGYNYTTTPILYKDGRDATPLTYAWDSDIMTYYIRVDGDLKNQWILETSDYVKPIIYEGDSGKELKVEILRRRGSFNLWKIS